MALSKAQLARLAFARLREIAPNEPFASVDQETIETEIELCKARLEKVIFNGVTLWTNDATIPAHLAEGFLLCLLPVLASHYGAVTVPPELAGEGYRELCRQLTTGYQPEAVEPPVLPPSVPLPGALSVVINSTVLPGDRLPVRVPYTLTLTGWSLLAESSCDLTLDVRRGTFATYPVTTTIAGTQKPTLAAAQKAQSEAVDSWDTAIASDAILEIVIEAVTGLTTTATLTLTYLR